MKQLCTIGLLGGLRVRRGDQAVTHFRTQKTQFLLAYLACFPHRAHAREELIELFWADTDPVSGRMSLRTALSAIRRELEASDDAEQSILIADRSQVQINLETVSTDIMEFEAACQNADQAREPQAKTEWLQRAVALYRGPLLPGCYEDWALRERERLEQKRLDALRDLAAAAEEQGDRKTALDALQRIVNSDPLQEEAHGALIRLYLADNQPAAARRQFQTLARVLREEMGAAPSPEICRLLESAAPAAPAAVRRSPAPLRAGPPAAASVVAQAPASVREPVRPPLPATFNRFFGRDEEIAQVTAMLRSALHGAPQPRLVTLTGPGGTGKTRLAIETARRLSEDFDGEVYFISFADITDPRLVPDTLLTALRLEHSMDMSPFEQIAARFQARPALFVLDNLEQLLDDSQGHAEATTQALRELLEYVPTVLCLVTSRRRLDMTGEQDFPLLPLPVPERTASREHLLACPSVQLFMDRSQAARPDFQVTATNAEAVAALCLRIEGVPLALELAAAWAATLSPAQILARLERGLELLSSSRRDLPPRHRTLRAAIEGSYRLLTPELQHFFVQLSVFRGGWTLEAAEAVAVVEPWVRGLGEPPISPPHAREALGYLAELQAHSLVRAEETEDEMRYRLLETLREYAASQLSAEEQAELQTRHLGYYRELALKASDGLNSDQQSRWLERLQSEYDNFRAAFEWSLSAPERAWAGLEMAQGLHLFWIARGYFAEGYRILTQMLDHNAGGPGAQMPPLEERADLRSRALNCAAELAVALSDFPAARRLTEESLAIAREGEDQNGIAYALCYLGILADREGDLNDAAAYFEQSLALWRALNNKGGMCHTLKCLGENLLKRGDPERAEALLKEGLAYARERHNPRSIVSLLGAIGELHLIQQDHSQAVLVLKEHLTLARELKDMWHMAYALGNSGRAAILQGDFSGAKSCYEQCLAIRRELGDRYGEADGLRRLGDLALQTNDLAAARSYFHAFLLIPQARHDLRMLAEALASCVELARREGAASRAALLSGALQALKTRLGLAASSEGPFEAEERAQWERGSALSLEEVIAQALS